MKISRSSIPEFASGYAYGYALALADEAWTFQTDDDQLSENIYRAIKSIETFSVLIDAGSDHFQQLDLETLQEQADLLNDNSPPNDFLKLTYTFRVKAVQRADIEAAATYKSRFDQLQSAAMQD